MMYGKTILSVLTGLLLLLLGAFVITLQYTGRISATVFLTFKKEHLPYVTLGSCISMIGLLILLHGCKLYCFILQVETKANKEALEDLARDIEEVDGSSENLTDVQSLR